MIQYMSLQARTAVFLDRDGVINRDTGYPHRLDEFELMPGAIAAIAAIHQAGVPVFVVTNQGGIGLGLYDHQSVALFHAQMLAEVVAGGGHITDIAYCPHHPDAGAPHMRQCLCRKPSPLMLQRLAGRHNIDLASSIMIGDRQTDMTAASAAGCRGFLFNSGRLDNLVLPLIDSLVSERQDVHDRGGN